MSKYQGYYERVLYKYQGYLQPTNDNVMQKEDDNAK